MTLKRVRSERFSLTRWSRRKLESAIEKAAAPALQPTAPVPAVAGAPVELPPVELPPVELPPVESLTFDSDFTAFMRPEVDPLLRRAALKRLLHDPRFNVMDGLDVYIDDYTKADPIPRGMLSELLERFDFGESAPGAPAPAGEREQACKTPAATGEAAKGETPPRPAAGERAGANEPLAAAPSEAMPPQSAPPAAPASAADAGQRATRDLPR